MAGTVDAGTLKVTIKGDAAPLRAAIEQAQGDVTKAVGAIAGACKTAFRAIDAPLRDFGRSMQEMSRSIKDVFGNDATSAAKAFGGVISDVTGVSREQFLRLGEGIKATKDAFELAAGAVSLMLNPLALTLAAVVAVAAAAGQVKRAFRETFGETATGMTGKSLRNSLLGMLPGPFGAMASGYAAAKDVGGAVDWSVGSGATGAEGNTPGAGAVVKAVGKDALAGLEELIPGVTKAMKDLVEALGPSKDALKSAADARKAEADAAKDTEKAQFTAIAAEQAAIRDTEAPRLKALADEQTAVANLTAEQNNAMVAQAAAMDEQAAGIEEAQNRMGAAAAKGSEEVAKYAKRMEEATAPGYAVAGQFASAAGGQTGALAQAALSGGPAGAITQLLTMSKGFTEAVAKMNGAIQLIADAVGTVFEVFTPILEPVLEAFKALAPLIKMLAVVGVAPLIVLFGPLILTMKLLEPAFRAVGDVLNELWQKVNGLLNIIGLGSQATVSSGYIPSTDELFAQGFAELERMKAAAAAEKALRDAQEAAEKEARRAAKEKAQADREAAAAARAFGESLTNLPATYKSLRAMQAAAAQAEELPHFAGGGIVTGPTVAVVGEAGPEAIVPLGRAGGAGGLTIQIFEARDAEETARQVVRALERRKLVSTGSPMLGAPAFVAG